MGLSRHGRARDRVARLALEDLLHRARDPRAALGFPPALPGLIGISCALARPFGGLASLRRWQINSSTPRLGKSDGDRLLGRAGSMLAVANFLDFFPHEL